MPWLFDVVLRSLSVVADLIDTVAPAIVAPLGSVTLPVICPVSVCARPRTMSSARTNQQTPSDRPVCGWESIIDSSDVDGFAPDRPRERRRALLPLQAEYGRRSRGAARGDDPAVSIAKAIERPERVVRFCKQFLTNLYPPEVCPRRHSTCGTDVQQADLMFNRLT